MSLRVSQPLWSTSAHAGPNCAREYPGTVAEPRTNNAPAAVVPGADTDTETDDEEADDAEDDEGCEEHAAPAKPTAQTRIRNQRMWNDAAL